MSIDIAPGVPLDTQALLQGLLPSRHLSHLSTHLLSSYVEMAGRAVRQVAHHLKLLHSVWEQIYLLQQEEGAVSGGDGWQVATSVRSSPQHLACFTVQVEWKAGL
mmetsp:Transcript_60692/g.88950  ORF Transcript_60692/g.88950 Transcript_60692/m.88950 type:complete len:105 (+) Transcript_60692:147-461(+)